MDAYVGYEAVGTFLKNSGDDAIVFHVIRPF